MMKYYLLFAFYLLIISLEAQEEQLIIEGAVTIGNANNENPEPGTLQWTGSDLQVWNGFTWLSLINFQVNDVVSDGEGNQYYTVVIGDQEWFAQNLRVSKYQNGDTIPNVVPNNDWINLDTGAYSWYLHDSAMYEVPYGKLYNWFAVDDVRGLCPAGWHVPTDAEWTTMIDFIGGLNIAGGKLKEEGFSHWDMPNTGATNEVGFTGLPGGSRLATTGLWSPLGRFGNYWSSSEANVQDAYVRRLFYTLTESDRIPADKEFGFSVRCIKD